MDLFAVVINKPYDSGASKMRKECVSRGHCLVINTPSTDAAAM
jgi:hypothetical protein